MKWRVAQPGPVKTRSNITCHSMTAINICRTFARLWTHKKHPFLALTGELWGVSCDYFEGNCLRYNGTALYTSQVYVSTRRGNWLLKRTTPSGMPGDIEFGTRFLACINHYAPNTVNDIVEKRCLAEFDHEKYGLRPSHRSVLVPPQ